MNSLNILSSRVIGQTTPSRSSSKPPSPRDDGADELPHRNASSEEASDRPEPEEDEMTEKTPLLPKSEATLYKSKLHRLVKRITRALSALLSIIGAPVVYAARPFKDAHGYSPTAPLRKLRALFSSGKSSNKHTMSEKGRRNEYTSKLRSSASRESLTSGTSESEDNRKTVRTQSRPHRRSIRIQEHQTETLEKRKKKRKTILSEEPLTLDTIKSPLSASQSLKIHKYPHAPAPPRPLIPRRQPSYTNLTPRFPGPRTPRYQKTLVLDLDETLIHSLAKGGRMSSGHMVEVKLNAPIGLSSSPSAPVLGPQHPILYYVHKRPHCDEFLRKIAQWFRLVVFTASVQEYADPVIDWLEQERKVFAGRYYRQHCTFRTGAYIKDLSSVEPDLSKVAILDNSPMSYVFNEDNAIPIEGWINDPTDNDLLHLIPLLEALQYATDVRAVLALRRGEAEA